MIPQGEKDSAAPPMQTSVTGTIVYGDNLPFLRSLASGSIDLIYIDPPFNTGLVQSRRQIEVVHNKEDPDRVGFKGRGYQTRFIGQKAFRDIFDDYESFIVPRLEEAYRILAENGSLFFHMDYREVHYCKLYLDKIFGRTSFINEIIWTYDFGARSKSKWSPKHENILWYAKNPDEYTFNYEAMDRIPYLAPGLVGPEKAAIGKTPSDTWWNTIVSPTGREKTGYPTQKPLAIVKRIVAMHSKPGDTVLDFFAGSGTTGEACARLGRNYILVDSNPEAIEVMKKRLVQYSPEVVVSPKGIASPAVPAISTPKQSVHIIAAAVWDYEETDLKLKGPAKDLRMMRDLLDPDKSPTGIFPSATMEMLANPTVEQLRSAIVRYAKSRSASGDILVFYFSGHGATFGGNEFVFCLKDTKVNRNAATPIPLSVLRFDDIVSTLAESDVHPVFIIDACFSATALQTLSSKLVGVMQEEVKGASGSSYALLCACHSNGYAEDTKNGGAFTKALYEIASAGLGGEPNGRNSFLALKDLSAPIQEELAEKGFPLSKAYFGDDLPAFPFVRNVAYKPRRETLMHYHGDILDLLWNRGRPRTATITEIREQCGQSAYGNHKKLSYEPWALVENDGTNRNRRLTDKGIRFMEGTLKVPEIIERSPISNEWQASPDSRPITRAEIVHKGQPSKAS